MPGIRPKHEETTPTFAQASLTAKQIIGSHASRLQQSTFQFPFKSQTLPVLKLSSNSSDFPIPLLFTHAMRRVCQFSLIPFYMGEQSPASQPSSTILECCASTGGSSGQTHYYSVKGEKTLPAERCGNRTCQGPVSTVFWSSGKKKKKRLLAAKITGTFWGQHRHF